MQYLLHLVGAEKNVLAALVGHEEAETIRMPLHAALDQVELIHHAHRMLAVAHDLAVALHRLEAAAKDVQFFFLDFQYPGKLFLWNRHALFGKNLQNIFPARQRVFVLSTLALDEGVFRSNFLR